MDDADGDLARLGHCGNVLDTATDSVFRAGVEAHVRFGVLTEVVLAAGRVAKRGAENN